KTPARAGVLHFRAGAEILLLLFLFAVALEEARELLLEARDTAATIDELLAAAGPGRVRLRIDVEMHRVAFLAPGGAGGEFGPIGHDDLDGVIVRMNVGLHGVLSCGRRAVLPGCREFAGSITHARRRHKP